MPEKARAAGPTPLGYSLPLGHFIGYVNDTTDRMGIAGVQVVVYSSAFCSPTNCTPATTAADGSFRVVCPAAGGPGSNDAVVVQGTNWWMDNVSYNVCVSGVDTPVGTMYLVRDDVAVGVVLDSVTGKPIGGVTVQSISRDNTVLGYPSAVTLPNGSFMIGVPPLPSRVDFTPQPGYSSMFNYTNGTPGQGLRPQTPPWTGGIRMDPIYLVRETLVRAELVDTVSNGSAPNLAALIACDANGGGCLAQGPTVGGGTVYAFANPGPTYFIAEVAGYTQGFSPTMWVPPEPIGQVFDMGKIWVVPLGTARVQVDLSKPSGGSLPWSAPNSGLGSLYLFICSMDGYFTSLVVPLPLGGFNMTATPCYNTACFNAGSTVTIGAPPLRDLFEVKPDVTVFCALPFGPPQWPVPGNDPPVYPNTTVVNLTGGHQLASPSPVYLNLTVGDYIAGNVVDATTGQAPSTCFTVSSASTDNNYYGVESYSWDSCLTMPPPPWTPCQSLGSQLSTSFCIAVPPGNSKITVVAANYLANWTWVNVPTYCCETVTGGPGYPATLASSTADRVTSINLTLSYARVSGYAIVAGTPAVPVPVVTVSACPAPALVTTSCGNGFGVNGSFSDVPAPLGVDVLTVTSPGYSPQSIWVNVSTLGNRSVGTVPMYPLGDLSGQIVDPNGVGLYLADISYCPLALAAPCYNGAGITLGVGITTSAGTFNGTVPGGWLPWATYLVLASAPGYTTDWCFGNVSAGGYTQLPTMTLQPIGVNDSGARPAAPPRPASSSGPLTLAGTWIAGRIIDNRTGAGVFTGPGTGVAACTFSVGACGGIPDGSNTEGYFNGSVSPGLYFVNITVPGYQPASRFVNATQASFLDLGTIPIEPDYWVAGRVLMQPWVSITLSSGGTFGHGYAPAAAATGCDYGLTNCQPSIPIAADGVFNVSVPVGSRATILIRPTGGPYGGSAAGGFLDNRTTTNLSGPYNYLIGTNGYVPLDIFGVVAGKVFDNDSINRSANRTVPQFGLPYAAVSIQASGVHTATVSFTTNGAGDWVAVLPGGNGPNRTFARTTIAAAYPAALFNITDPIDSGGLADRSWNSSLQRFGWIAVRFDSSATGAAIPYVAAQAIVVDPRTGTSYSTTDVADHDGMLNLTAPSGRAIPVTVRAPDFNSTAFTVPYVNGSTTTFANGTGYAGLGSFSLPSYGFVFSDTLNFSGSPPPFFDLPEPIVVDVTNGLGLPGASPTVTSTDPSVAGGGSTPTNWNGQFYSDAPIGKLDTVSFVRPGYVTNSTTIPVREGEDRVYSKVNMTGDMVLAGQVVSEPGRLPVPGAMVQACTVGGKISTCGTAFTNLSGRFWMTIGPGNAVLTVSQTGFVSNSSFVRGCADCWIWVGTLSLEQYATVTGFVRGVPSGFPIIGANASLCYPGADPTGPCGPPALTNSYGHFVVSGPPGRYILAITDQFFNATYLPVALSAGEVANVGTLFLDEFGSAVGTVYDAATYHPLFGATVFACADFGEGSCAPTQTTNGAGGYGFSAAPGPYTITVTAPNYQIAYGAIRIASGVTTAASPIVLSPIGTDAPIALSGRVVSAANPDQGLSGTVVTAFTGNTSAFSTVTRDNGSFAMYVGYGTFELAASSPGYLTSVQTVVATQPLHGILFELSPMTYEVRGFIEDGLSGAPLVASTIWTTQTVNGTLTPFEALATTDPSSQYSLSLPNGTYQLEATSPSGGLLPYAPARFAVSVNGAPQFRNISMTPYLGAVSARVIDAGTGLPIPGAQLTLVGELVDGVHYSHAFTADAGGSLGIHLYAGQYLASVRFPDYRGIQRPFEVTGGASNLTFALASTSSPAASGGGLPLSTDLALGLSAAAIAVAAFLVFRRGGGKPPALRAERVRRG
jgi:hypothetical protein